MGIKNLNKLLRAKCPEVFENIHISEYSYKTIAIDTSLYLCSYKSCYGESGWLSAFIKLVACLRKNEVHCVFIYDSGCVPEKLGERAERRENRRKMEERVWKLEESLDEYHKTGEVSQLLKDFLSKRSSKQKRLLSPETKMSFDAKAAQYYIDKSKKQLFTLHPDDYKKTRLLFDILQVPYYDAPLEAETMCADLCKRGLVDGVLTEDTDVLAYGVPVFISKININTGECVRIKYGNLLQKIELTALQFLDLCIMCGTDYNKNIYRIGPSKAYDLIKKHEHIDGIKSNTPHDTNILKFIRVREIFTDYKKDELKKIPYCGAPEEAILNPFLKKHNIDISLPYITKSFINNNVIIIEE